MPVMRKYERDIDLLLAEEFSVCPAFADWFKSKTKFAAEEAVIADVHVSKSDNLGESDLIALFKRIDGKCFALMIEDKVDAPLQPDQASRYRLRAERMIKAGECFDYAVALCGPRFYLENVNNLAEFDVKIAFEDLAEWFRQSAPSKRELYRAQFLETAATRRANNWVREIDEVTESFWAAAYDLAVREFPILEMKPLKVTKDSTWINFRPADMPTLPRRIYISVKGDRGHMDLTFSCTIAYTLHDHVRDLIEADMTVHQTGKSTAIRLRTPGFSPKDGVEDGLPKVRASFHALRPTYRVL